MNTDRARRWCGILLLAGAVAACGDSPPAESAATTTAAARSPNADFTAAVPVGNEGAEARLHFQLTERPALNVPVTLKFRIVPSKPVQKIQLAFEPEAGLGIVDELRATLLLDGPAAAASEVHELQLVPTMEGVLVLKATLLTESERGAQVTDFAIPLLVGAGGAPGQ